MEKIKVKIELKLSFEEIEVKLYDIIEVDKKNVNQFIADIKSDIYENIYLIKN